LVGSLFKAKCCLLCVFNANTLYMLVVALCQAVSGQESNPVLFSVAASDHSMSTNNDDAHMLANTFTGTYQYMVRLYLKLLLGYAR
jgi:hypothetical protein